jgi:hypothetical protein
VIIDNSISELTRRASSFWVCSVCLCGDCIDIELLLALDGDGAGSNLCGVISIGTGIFLLCIIVTVGFLE